MGARGPAPQSQAQHEARGNPSKRAPKRNEPKLPPADAACPDYLKGNAAFLWNQLAPLLVKAGLLSVVGVPQLAALCSAFSTWRQYEGLCEEVGPQLAVQMGYRNAADRARDAMTRLVPRFGMDPASLTNVHANPPAEIEADDKRARFFGIRGGK